MGFSQPLASLSSDIVDQMLVLFRMGSWGFTMFWGGYILGEYETVADVQES